MTKEQEEAVYNAYLRICMLKRCAEKWGTESDVGKASQSLTELATVFPDVYQRILTMPLRQELK